MPKLRRRSKKRCSEELIAHIPLSDDRIAAHIQAPDARILFWHQIDAADPIFPFLTSALDQTSPTGIGVPTPVYATQISCRLRPFCILGAVAAMAMHHGVPGQARQ